MAADNISTRPTVVDDDGIERPIILRAEAKSRKLPRYFTGKRCKNGHIAERYTATGCVKCYLAYRWIWLSNPDNLQKRRFRARERAKLDRADPARAPIIRAQKKESAKRHAPKWRATMLHRLAGRQKPRHCEICNSDKRICFDHCHVTGQFRGWICNTCNSLLGIASDNADLLRNLADYLDRPRSGDPLPRHLQREMKVKPSS